MKTECDNNKRIIMLVLSVVFLIHDPDWFALASILLFMFSFDDYKISKVEGIIFLLIFVIYYTYVVFM